MRAKKEIFTVIIFRREELWSERRAILQTPHFTKMSLMKWRSHETTNFDICHIVFKLALDLSIRLIFQSTCLSSLQSQLLQTVSLLLNNSSTEGSLLPYIWVSYKVWCQWLNFTLLNNVWNSFDTLIGLLSYLYPFSVMFCSLFVQLVTRDLDEW